MTATVGEGGVLRTPPAPPGGWMVFIADEAGGWSPSWDGELYTNLPTALDELAAARDNGHVAALAMVRPMDPTVVDAQLAHRATRPGPRP